MILVSATISMLYKRALRKEKEVATFLIKVLKLNLAINIKPQAKYVGRLRLQAEQGSPALSSTARRKRRNE